MSVTGARWDSGSVFAKASEIPPVGIDASQYGGDIHAAALDAIAAALPLYLEPAATYSLPATIAVGTDTLTIIGNGATIHAPTIGTAISAGDGGSVYGRDFTLSGGDVGLNFGTAIHHLGGDGTIELSGVDLAGFGCGVRAVWADVAGTEYAATDFRAATVILRDRCSISANGDSAITVAGLGALFIDDLDIFLWGRSGTNQYHGIYLHSGVDFDVANVRFGDTDGTGWAFHVWHYTGERDFGRLRNIRVGAGAYNGIILTGGRASIEDYEFLGRGGGLFVNARSVDLDHAYLNPDPTSTLPSIRGYPLSGTAVSSTDVITSTGHGFNDDELMRVASGTGLGSLVVGSDYYIVNATSNTFQLSATIGGTPEALGDGSVNLGMVCDLNMTDVVCDGAAVPILMNGAGMSVHALRCDFPEANAVDVPSGTYLDNDIDLEDPRFADSSGFGRSADDAGYPDPRFSKWWRDDSYGALWSDGTQWLRTDVPRSAVLADADVTPDTRFGYQTWAPTASRTVHAPSGNKSLGQRLTIDITNAAGSAIIPVWDPEFLLSSPFVVPA